MTLFWQVPLIVNEVAIKKKLLERRKYIPFATEFRSYYNSGIITLTEMLTVSFLIGTKGSL